MRALLVIFMLLCAACVVGEIAAVLAADEDEDEENENGEK